MRGSFTSAASGHGRTRGRAYPGVRRSTCDRHAEVLLDEVRELVVGADHDILARASPHRPRPRRPPRQPAHLERHPHLRARPRRAGRSRRSARPGRGPATAGCPGSRRRAPAPGRRLLVQLLVGQLLTARAAPLRPQVDDGRPAQVGEVHVRPAAEAGQDDVGQRVLPAAGAAGGRAGQSSTPAAFFWARRAGVSTSTSTASPPPPPPGAVGVAEEHAARASGSSARDWPRHRTRRTGRDRGWAWRDPRCGRASPPSPGRSAPRRTTGTSGRPGRRRRRGSAHGTSAARARSGGG